MLFANNSGLLTFDGDEWRTYYVPNHTSVRSVFFDEKTRRTYVGATNEFGYFKVNPVTSRQEYHSLSSRIPEKRRYFDEVWNIFRLDNSIVFQCRHHIFFAEDNGRLLDMRFRSQVECSAVTGGRVIAVSENGIFSIKGGKAVRVNSGRTLRDMTVRTILPWKNKMLFVTVRNGVFVYDGASVTPFVMDITPFLTENQVFCAAAKDSCLAFGTVKGGFVMKNFKTGETVYSNTLTSLQNNTVLSVGFDKADNVWLGLDNGISYVLLDVGFRNLLGSNVNIGTGYASMRYGNQLYLGTNQGLFRMEYPVVSSPYPSVPSAVGGIDGQVWSLREIGGVMMCGCDDGAYIVSGGSSRKIRGLSGTWNFIDLKRGRHAGSPLVLACDYKGFVVLGRQGDGYRVVSRPAGLAYSGGNFLEDADGTIWAGHWQKGVYHLRLSDDLRRIDVLEFFNAGNGLVVNENNNLYSVGGKIYVSSVDGLHRYDPKSRRLVADRQMSGIFNTYGTSLAVMDIGRHDLLGYKSGFLAVAHKTGRGTYRVDSVSFKHLVRSMNVGLGSMYGLTPDKTVLNSVSGFYVINNNFRRKRVSGKLAVRRVTAVADTDSLLFTGGSAAGNEELSVPHSLNSLRVEFVMPEYREEKSVAYSCYLEGYDKQWGREQFSTVKDYPYLPKGDYILHVRARNLISGVTEEVRMKIRVLPAWYESWYAYLIYILLAVAAVRALAELIKRRAEREFIREKEENERAMREQIALAQIESDKKEKELMRLRNEQLVADMKHKSGQMADSAMNLMRKNDMLQDIDSQMKELYESVRKDDTKDAITRRISSIRHGIKVNMADDDNWEKFEENFNLVYDKFMKTLTGRFEGLKKNDLKLCAYLKMGLSTKEMATLLNTSARSIETARYRLRKKLNLDNGENLTDFIQNIDKDEGGSGRGDNHGEPLPEGGRPTGG